MNKVHLISTAMLIPAVIFAEVNFHLSVGTTHGDCEYTAEADYTDDGDPWFEESDDCGDSHVSFEYQWSMYGSGHVLRYRQVTFHIENNLWVFGPWLIKTNYCHQSCRLHHHHVFYHHVSNTDWHRVYDNRKHVYFYEYRNPRYVHFGHNKVYRHEYRPVYMKRPESHKHHEHHYDNPGKHDDHRKYDNREYDHRKNDHRSENQSGQLYKKSGNVDKNQREYHKDNNSHQGNREVQRSGSKRKITLVSGRN